MQSIVNRSLGSRLMDMTPDRDCQGINHGCQTVTTIRKEAAETPLIYGKHAGNDGRKWLGTDWQESMLRAAISPRLS
jgi:hypothetical protein